MVQARRRRRRCHTWPRTHKVVTYLSGRCRCDPVNGPRGEGAFLSRRGVLSGALRGGVEQWKVHVGVNNTALHGHLVLDVGERGEAAALRLGAGARDVLVVAGRERLVAPRTGAPSAAFPCECMGEADPVASEEVHDLAVRRSGHQACVAGGCRWRGHGRRRRWRDRRSMWATLRLKLNVGLARCSGLLVGERGERGGESWVLCL